MKKKVIIVLLCIHLLLLYTGTSLFDFSKLPASLQPAVSYYLSLVGGHPYNFFSPEIPTQTVVRCTIHKSDGSTYTETLEKFTNSFELRSTYLFQILDDAEGYETAAKIAAHYCFKEHPDARSVDVSIGRFVVPDINDYKQGVGNSFSEVYIQNFPHE